MSTTAILADISPEQLTSIQAQVRSELEPKLREENAIELAKFKDTLRQQNDEAIREAIKNFEENERKNRKPLTTDELQVLLSQEYSTFKVVINERGTSREFTLVELPQEIERKFAKIAKNALGDLIKEFGAIDFKSMQGDMAEKLLSLMNLYDPIQDLMAKCCVICLNPWDEDKDITEDWVKRNLANNRILNILLAQVEVNKMRDFFSRLFQGFLGVPKNPVDAQL